MSLESHRHVLIAGSDAAGASLILMHGSGGDEHELVPLAGKLAPGATLLGIRGAVPFEGGSAFFHRRADRTIDEADIAERCPVLVDFIESAAANYAFGKAPIALAFSNGAIMAAALLLMRPKLLSAAILLRPLSPFARDMMIRLPATPVLIIDGAKDSRRSPGDGERLAERLTRAGAVVSHNVLPVGHSSTALDEELVGDWLGRLR
jgi:phospholipase/carboxylesterase